jgi:PKD repeat protein
MIDRPTSPFRGRGSTRGLTSVQGTLLLVAIVVLLSVSIAIPFLQGGSNDKIEASEDQAATIQTSGLAPNADFTHSTPVYADAPIRLNASSTDLNGADSATYEWDLDGDGTYETTGEVITHTFSEVGNASVELRVTRDDVTALPDSVTKTLTVERAPAPDAQFTHTSPVYVDESVTLDASTTDIGDSDNVSYEWDLDGDGTYETTGEVISHTFTEVGDTSVELRVTKHDIPAPTDNTTTTITVEEDPAPIARFTIKDGPRTIGATNEFDASNSSDPHGTIVSYEWDFASNGDIDDTGETVTHRYNSKGERTVSLTVTDDDGQSNTTTESIRIEDANGDRQTNKFWGDPHMTTLDGKKYDFMGIGEFVLTRDKDGDGPNVQIRTDRYGFWGASVTTAAALEVDGHTVVLDFEEGGRGNAPDQLRVDGESRSIEDGTSIAVGNGAVFRHGDSYTVIYPGANDRVDDSDTAFRFTERYSRGTIYVDMDMHLNESAVSEMEGLIGNADGDRSNDIQTEDGEILTTSYQDLYGKLDASWRLTTESASLFDHDDGRSIDEINEETFPSSEVVSMNDLTKQQRTRGKELAREHCLDPDTATFENAIIDWAVTIDKSIFDRLAPEDCQSG